MIASRHFVSSVADMLTHVELIWRPKAIEQRLRFGHPVVLERLSRERQRLSFAPGAVFAVLRWSGNAYGTTSSRIDILRAAGCGQAFTTVPQVTPGGVLLLSITTWAKVERVLQAIDAVEAVGFDPSGIATDHWQHIHNRISVGETPRRYTKSRHDVWLKRRRIVP